MKKSDRCGGFVVTIVSVLCYFFFFFYLLSFNLSLLFFIATFGTLSASLKPNKDQ